jgi:hypothetical protein
MIWNLNWKKEFSDGVDLAREFNEIKDVYFVFKHPRNEVEAKIVGGRVILEGEYTEFSESCSEYAEVSKTNFICLIKRYKEDIINQINQLEEEINEVDSFVSKNLS